MNQQTTMFRLKALLRDHSNELIIGSIMFGIMAMIGVLVTGDISDAFAGRRR